MSREPHRAQRLEREAAVAEERSRWVAALLDLGEDLSVDGHADAARRVFRLAERERYEVSR